MSPKKATSILMTIAFAALFMFTIISCGEPIDDSHETNTSSGDAVVNIAAIQGVTAPETGRIPVTTIIGTTQYTGTVEWSPAVSETFEYEIQYTAIITLTAKTGYTLKGVKANFFTVTGAASVSNSADSGVVTAVFPQTDNTAPPPAGSEQRSITITETYPFNYGYYFKISLFSTNSFLDIEPVYQGTNYSYQDEVTIDLCEIGEHNNPWYGDGQYYAILEISNYYNSYIYRCTEPITFSDANTNPTIDFSSCFVPSIYGPVNTTAFTANTWTDGYIPESNGEQWFCFNATANDQYIHVNFGTMGTLFIQTYDADGNAVGNQTDYITSNPFSDKYISRTLNVGQKYYIRVFSSDSVTYRIAFNTSPTTPPITIPSGATQLTHDLWTRGNIPTSDGEQWFKFTATAATQYIHIALDTLTILNFQVYDSSGNMVGDQRFFDRDDNTSRYLNNGHVYYIKISPYVSYSGTYRIAFNTSVWAPPTPASLPSDATTLTANIWTNNSIPQFSDQWYKFTATSATQYIHFNFITYIDMYVQVYDSNGYTVGSQTNLSGTSSTTYTSRTLTVGQEYYINFHSQNVSYPYGAYRIAFGEFSSSPTLISNITKLTTGLWADGNIPSSDDNEQWFKFTATAATQYIHVNFGTLNDLNVNVYKPNGDYIDYKHLSGSTKYASMTLNVGQEYYIRVSPYSSSGIGTYKIAFSASTMTPTTVIALTVNTWTFGNITNSSGEQWYKFTATAATQYIHAGFSTLTGLYVQVYDSNLNTVGSQTNLSGSFTNISRTLSIGSEYYVRVSPYSGSGTYQVALNASSTPPAAISTLTANTWAEGNITSGSGYQLFKFTATAGTQYIHIIFGTLTNLYLQVYDSNNNTVGNQTYISGSTRYTSRSLTIGQEYYIKVLPYNSSYNGTYRIGFNSSTATPPITMPSGAIQLTASTWTDGNISTSGGEQWFKFTATSSTQYIHVYFGALNNMYVQVYDSTGSTVEYETNLYNTSKYVSRTLNVGHEYYIKVWPYNSYYSGTYRIAFNASSTAPSIILPANATRLTVNNWADGNITSSGAEQWFKFTATAATQYIHVGFGSLNNLYVQVYDSSGYTIENETNLNSNNNSAFKYASRNLNVGQEYYIKVWSYSAGSTYRIAFNTLSLPPSFTSAVQLTRNTWTNSSINTSDDEQWFKFTVTETTQYIHAYFGTLTDMYVQVYNSNGTSLGNQTRLYTGTKYASQTFSAIGQEYYIKVSPNSGSGTYWITFNTYTSPPMPPATQLTANTWAEGNITASGSEQWFKFSATAVTQYIHIDFGTLTDIYVQVYNSSGTLIGNQRRFTINNGSKYVSQTLTVGQEYYINVSPNSGSGTYLIAFNTSSTESPITLLPSNATRLTANTWTDDNIPINNEHWFKFSATAASQYIHVGLGTLTNLCFQVYDSNGSKVGAEANYSGNTTALRTLNVGQEYYIKVWSYSAGGTYRIAFNTILLSPAGSNAIQLTENIWTDGSGYTERWLKLTATAARQYIHAIFGNLTSLSIQLYDSNLNTIEAQIILNSSNKYAYYTVTVGNEYYIKESNKTGVGSTGTYGIGFTSSSLSPTFTSATRLNSGLWANGNITASSIEQGFKFTATSATQYIHYENGTLTNLTIQVYSSSGSTIGSQTSSSGISMTLSVGQEYYIKVLPYNSSDTGTYRISFNASSTPPANATTLGANGVWVNGNISTSVGEQWFKLYEPIGTIQNINISFGTLTNLYVQLYDSNGNTFGSQINFDNSTTVAAVTINSGQEYYIKVWPYGSGSGTYRIGINIR